MRWLLLLALMLGGCNDRDMVRAACQRECLPLVGEVEFHAPILGNHDPYSQGTLCVCAHGTPQERVLSGGLGWSNNKLMGEKK